MLHDERGAGNRGRVLVEGGNNTAVVLQIGVGAHRHRTGVRKIFFVRGLGIGSVHEQQQSGGAGEGWFLKTEGECKVGVWVQSSSGQRLPKTGMEGVYCSGLKGAGR